MITIIVLIMIMITAARERAHKFNCNKFYSALDLVFSLKDTLLHFYLWPSRSSLLKGQLIYGLSLSFGQICLLN